MKSEQILEVLSKLDPSNKDHWTQDGQPRLGAVGEGVTRQQILEVAPLFSRSNPAIEENQEQPITDEEVKSILEDRLVEIELKKQEANQALLKAGALRIEAERLAKEANQTLEAMRDEQKCLDPRTATEINQDLLKASFAERLRRAGAQSQARQLLEQAGLVNELRALSVSPVDRAIAERVIKQRREQARGKK